jgi:carbamoyltransferase
MHILGLNAFHGDASAAILDSNGLVAAVEQERFNRIKHWAGFPDLAAQFCLKHVDPSGPLHVAISRDPKSHFWTKVARLATRPGYWPRAISRARNSAEIAQLGKRLGHLTGSGRRTTIHHVEHHRAHLASAFFCSPFEEAAVVSIDGFGDFSSVMWGVGRGNKIDVRGSVQFPHSLGLFYTAFTQYLGFPKYGDEYKMMGLSAYGEPRYRDKVRQALTTRGADVRLNLDFFTHHSHGVEMSWEGGEPTIGTVYSSKLVDLFGPARLPRTGIEQHHRDLAASVQAVLEENYFELLRHVQRESGMKNVCLAGGVALNCVANGMIFDQTPFTGLYVQPASHDAGTSIGAALHVQHQILDRPRSFVMRHVYWGPEHTDTDIRRAIGSESATAHKLSSQQVVDATAAALADGKIVGWYQGRAEFGPRALGNRSILADPRRTDMKDTLNARIKYREPFRPFCPSILSERTGEFFETDYPSPFMVQAYKIRAEKRTLIPAVSHEDGTGRLQTVERDVNPLYWNLLKKFDELTGVPVLINTSFNENEPIVNTPEEALSCFLRTNMDVLVMGSYILNKVENRQKSEDRTKAA